MNTYTHKHKQIKHKERDIPYTNKKKQHSNNKESLVRNLAEKFGAKNSVEKKACVFFFRNNRGIL